LCLVKTVVEIVVEKKNSFLYLIKTVVEIVVEKNSFLCLVNMLCVLGLILELLKRTYIYTYIIAKHRCFVIMIT